MLRIVTTPADGRTLLGATYRSMFEELSDRDPFVYETPCFQWTQAGRRLESLPEERAQDIPEPKPKGILSWLGVHAASAYAMSRKRKLG